MDRRIPVEWDRAAGGPERRSGWDLEKWPIRIGRGGAGLEAQSFALGVAVAISCALAVPAVRPHWVVRFPVAVLTLLLAVSTLAAIELFRFEPPGVWLALDPSTEPLLPRGDPVQDVYRQAVLDFGDDEVFVIAVGCDEVFSVFCLSAIDRVTTRVANLDGIRSVSSLMDVTSFRYEEEEDWVVVEPFMDEVPSDPAELAELKFRALNDPVYRKTIVAEDSRSSAINVRFQELTDGEFIDADLDGQIVRIVEEEWRPGLRFHIAGRPHIKVHVYRGMVHDIRILIPVSIALMALMLWLFTGDVRGVVVPLFTALMSNLWTFAAMAHLEFPLTLLTGLLGPMLLALGSVYGIHVLFRYYEEAETSLDGPTAAVRCLEHVMMPVLIAGFTTVVGFAALLITDVPAVFELGAFSMLGIASATLIVSTGAPALLALLPLRAAAGFGLSHAAGQSDDAGSVLAPAGLGRRLAARLDHALTNALDRLARWVGQSIRRVTWLGLGLVLGASMAIPFIVIDTDYLSYFDERDPMRRDFDAVNRLLAGAVPLYVAMDGPPGQGAFREPQALHAMSELQEKFDRIEGVSRTLSFVETIEVLNRAFHAGDPAQERIPETRPAVTELLYMVPKSELQRFATVNHGKANLIVRTGEVGSAAIQKLYQSLEAAIHDTALPEGVTASVTGNAVLLARSADGIARSQPLSVALAALTIFLVIALGLRSPRLGMVAMIPNLVPVIIFFGLLGIGAAPLSLPTSMIGCVALGIAIDDTVHFMVRYRAERAAGASPEDAAQSCGRNVGRPIALTSIVLVAGFLVVAFSDFATLQEFGILAAVTMGICLLNDLVLLPALLLRFRV